MRQTFETQNDRDHEAAFARIVEAKWNCALRKLPHQYRLDYACTRGEEIVCWLEYKFRNVKSDTYDSYMLSFMKWQAGKSFHIQTGLPFVLAVQYSDKVRYYRYSKESMKDIKLVYRGRTLQARDSQDSEPCVLIPNYLFTDL